MLIGLLYVYYVLGFRVHFWYILLLHVSTFGRKCSKRQTLSGEGSILTSWCICDLGVGFPLFGEGAENIIMLSEVKLVNLKLAGG